MPEAEAVSRLRFSIFAAAVQGGLIALFVIFVRYAPEANGGKYFHENNKLPSPDASNQHINNYYPRKLFFFFSL